MRHGIRTRHGDEGEESAFISMTDMMVSFLFIMLILLAFFATQIAPRDTVPKTVYDKVVEELALFRQKAPLLPDLLAAVERLRTELRRIRDALSIPDDADAVAHIEILRGNVVRLQRENDDLRRQLKDLRENNPIARYNARVTERRGQILERVQKRIQAIDKTIDVAVSRNRDALEFKGDGLFPSGSDVASATGRRKMELIAATLKEELRCYTIGDRSSLSERCNPEAAILDALQVEGHTDSTGPDVDNMGLSSRRGASIYAIMATNAPELLELKNVRGQPILSVAGYGEGRPIRENNTSEGRDANRRIDLRVLMFAPTEEQLVPRRVEDVPLLRELLLRGAAP
jgi:flagellar motor protein MotB